MAPLVRGVLVVALSVACVLLATSCAQKPRPIPPGVVIVAKVPTRFHNGYLVLWGNNAKKVRYGLIADEHLNHVFHTNRRGQLLDQRNRDIGVPPCGNPQKFRNFDNEDYAVSNDGRMIYCVSGTGGGGPLKGMLIGDPSSLRTSSITFWDNNAGSISYMSKTEIALLGIGASCIDRFPGGHGTRLVIFNPVTDRIVRRLRCTDGIIPYRSGFMLSRRVAETGNVWTYSIDGKTWVQGTAVGATPSGLVYYGGADGDLRAANDPGAVIARNVNYAMVFNDANVASLVPLSREPKAKRIPVKR
uniref:Uncharacterized protein n=1 Tax=mine drainage metagenome TaxID=410659 RepID=E6Q312_9ZZZZ